MTFVVMFSGYHYSEACASLSGTNEVPTGHASYRTGTVDGETVVGKTPIQEVEGGG
jgi:hypothetical protein